MCVYIYIYIYVDIVFLVQPPHRGLGRVLPPPRGQRVELALLALEGVPREHISHISDTAGRGPRLPRY